MTEAGERGLTSEAGLARLHQDLKETVRECRERRRHYSWVRAAWWPGSPRSLFRVTSLVTSMLLILALIASSSDLPNLGSAVIMLGLTVASLMLSGWESYQRSVEVYKRADRLVEMVRGAAGESSWSVGQYPNLHTPPASSLFLQRTVRDGVTVNLPWALLVAEDRILMRPGDSAPAKCHHSDLELERGQTFFPPEEDQENSATAQTFVLDETPYLKELQRVLSKDSEAKPLSMLMKQRQFLVTSLLEYICTPVVLVLVLAWNCVRKLILQLTNSSYFYFTLSLCLPV